MNEKTAKLLLRHMRTSGNGTKLVVLAKINQLIHMGISAPKIQDYPTSQFNIYSRNPYCKDELKKTHDLIIATGEYRDCWIYDLQGNQLYPDPNPHNCPF